jgi:hypothetical protein
MGSGTFARLSISSEMSTFSFWLSR